MKSAKTYLTALATVALSAAGIVPLFAQAGSAQSEEEKVLAEFQALQWMPGPTTAKVGYVASQKVPSGHAFLESVDARKFLELNKNPASISDVGVIISENGWFASYSYDAIGYVSDDEKESLDSDAILNVLKKSTRESNAERRKHGWPELTILGWVVKPHYDEATHNLEWATKAQSSDGIVVNYNTRILGRGGVMCVTLVCEPENLEAVLPEFKTALDGFDYNAGSRYAEYRSGDRVADIGLTALIAGGATAVAMKSGVFKWLWKVIVVVAVAIGGFFKKLFGGGQKEDEWS